jgi:DNA-directed RNA polymerase subunit RPC12/RpoP
VTSADEKPKEVFPEAIFECTRCGTRVDAEELSKLPEPTCANCGYKVFRKVRGPTAKQVRAV